MARFGVVGLARDDRLVEARGFLNPALAMQGDSVLERRLAGFRQERLSYNVTPGYASAFRRRGA
ncbi:MAG: hypothetical protein ABSF67_17280 [Roseiarcus sp.]|jgi:hypothetical protein